MAPQGRTSDRAWRGRRFVASRSVTKNSNKRGAPRADHPIHRAAQLGDLKRVREMLDADP
jgi:hypothetical protein